jgi:hypothetical protein
LIAPLFTELSVPTVGASGAIYGILVAFGLMFPDRPIFIYFLFPIKAKYFVLIYMAIEFLSVGSNTGIAHVAHLGGGVIGFLYLLLTNSSVYSIFRFNRAPKPRSGQGSKVYRNRYYDKYNTGNENDDDVTDADYYIEKEKDDKDVSQERIDEILDKISKHGYKNLSEEEKRILFEASKKIH